jgi:hypothetical protein
MRRLSLGMAVLLSFIGCATAYPAFAQLTISSASWDSRERRLTVRGTGDDNEDVTVRNAYQTTQVLGTDEVEGDGDWRVRRSRPSPVPCAVQASAPGDTPVIRAVSNAPSTCSPKAPTVTPAVSINNVTVTEGGSANFTVSLSAASTQTVTVVASTANGTATAPGDFTARTSVTLTFPAGTTTQSFTVATVNDTAVESTETFYVNLSGANNATIADNQGVGTINDNDVAPQPSLSINNVTVTEGGSANFTVSLSAASTQTVTVVASTANGTATAPGDFTARTGVTLTFPAGNTTQSFAVATVNDTAVESTETFNVNLHHRVHGTRGLRGLPRDEARDMHGSVHYQQNGPTDYVTNIDGLGGERGFDYAATGINTYCGTHENSPRFTCAGCHVGNGRFPMAQSEFELLDPSSPEAHAQLANIDCLMCHQEVYKRFPDWSCHAGAAGPTVPSGVTCPRPTSRAPISTSTSTWRPLGPT